MKYGKWGRQRSSDGPRFLDMKLDECCCHSLTWGMLLDTQAGREMGSSLSNMLNLRSLELSKEEIR